MFWCKVINFIAFVTLKDPKIKIFRSNLKFKNPECIDNRQIFNDFWIQTEHMKLYIIQLVSLKLHMLKYKYPILQFF